MKLDLMDIRVRNALAVVYCVMIFLDQPHLHQPDYLGVDFLQVLFPNSQNIHRLYRSLVSLFS